MFSREKKELDKIIKNMNQQGKTKQQIKNAIGIYLKENKKKVNPNGELDII